jgi:hypothetical protein
VVDAFRADLGNPNNGTAAGSQPSGRREITWDGGGAAANATTFGVPMTNFANRGNVYTTAGSGFEISGQPTPEFGDINPTYPAAFVPFSSPRLFAPLGSTITDVLFTRPGSTSFPALTNGFGVVFTDVDSTDTTSLEFFDFFGTSLGTFSPGEMNNGLSFVGVLFTEAVVNRVRITSGNTPLGPNESGDVDVVAMDDFIFGEPQAVPEPATWLTLAAGLAAGLALRRRVG